MTLVYSPEGLGLFSAFYSVWESETATLGLYYIMMEFSCRMLVVDGPIYQGDTIDGATGYGKYSFDYFHGKASCGTQDLRYYHGWHITINFKVKKVYPFDI